MKTTLAVAIVPLLSAAVALQPVTIKGNAFFAGDERFYIRGVDYQPGGDAAQKDPIADAAGCKRDIQYFKQLGINTIRVYTVDNSAEHDECMAALAQAGIYLALDVNNKGYSINRAEPAPSYNDVYLQSVFATIDAFAKYDNTLLFFSANEVINDDKTTSAAPYVKAVTRDMRAYIRAQGHRVIPVGYSAADVESNRYDMATYMNCGSEAERADFHAFNDYSWCDPSTYQTSGWDKKVAQFQGYSIPLFLSEYGCNINAREFEEVASLYSSDMTPVYSGGLVYEYSQEPSNYGLVTLKGNSVKPLPDFGALKTALDKTPAPSGDGGFTTGGLPSKCPAKSATWEVGTNLLPLMPIPARKFLKQGAGKGPGLEGEGSQHTGTPSPGWGNSKGVIKQKYTNSASTSSDTSAGATREDSAAGALTADLRSVSCMLIAAMSSSFISALF